MAKKNDNLKGVDLEAKLASLREDIRVIRFKAEGSKSKNVKELMNLKKQIARIMTQLSSNKNK